jgi:hypothetical protein
MDARDFRLLLARYNVRLVDLSAESGLHRNVLSRIKHGHRVASVDQEARIRAALQRLSRGSD